MPIPQLDCSARGLSHMLDPHTVRPLSELFGGIDPTSLVAEALPHLVWSARPDGYCDFFNSRWYEFTGGSPDEHLGWGWWETIHAGDRMRVARDWASFVAEDRPFEAEYRIKGADGAYRWFLARGVPLRNGDSEVVRWFGTCTDIQSQKEAQEMERFLADLSDRIRPIVEPDDVMWTAVAAIGQRLAVSRAAYADIDIVNDQVIVSRDYHQDVPSIAGVFPMKFFAEETIREAREGKVVVCGDTERDPRTAHRFQSSYGPKQICAFISVPVVKEGTLQYILTVQSARPREWTDAEVALLLDVAERTAEAVLRAHLFRTAQTRAEELAFVVENAPAFICRVGTDYRYLYVNASHSERFGLTPEDVVGMHVSDLLGEEAFAAIRPYMDRAFLGEHVSYSLEVPYRELGMRHIQVGYAPYFDEQSGSRGLVGIIQDMTEAKRAEEALSAIEASFRALIQQAPEAVFVASMDGIFTDVNAAACAMLGYPAEALLGQRIADLIREEDRASFESFRESQMESGAHYNEWEMRRQDGTYVRCELNARILPDGRWIGFAHDITVRNRERIEIEALNRRLQRAMTETHHRVKNNLQVVSALIDLQVMQHPASVPAQELRRLGHHVTTLAAVHDVLTEQAKNDADVEFVSASAILRNLVPLLQRMAAEHSVDAELEDASLTARQGTGLALVATELVSNALKHGKSDVTVRFCTGDRSARLIVRDGGPGFPPSFDPSLAANTGLELVTNLSRWDLGGSIAFMNRKEGGAEVAVEIPLTPAQQCAQSIVTGSTTGGTK